MPALVNYNGEDEFCYPRYICPTDFFFPPAKCARIMSPFALSFEEEKTPSIEVLPDECLFEILRHLSGGQSRSASACVSKCWLMLLTSISNSKIHRSGNNESEVNKSTDFDMISSDEGILEGYLTRSLEGQKATDIRLAAISVGTSSRGGLGKLSIRGSNSAHGVTNNGLSAIAHGCPSLRVLSLWNVPLVGDRGIINIAKECYLLEKLDLCQCPSISDKGLIAIAKNCPNLTSLTIESCAKIGNESLQAIGQHCHKLNYVSIRDCPLMGDQGVASLFSSLSSVLTKVKLQSLRLTDFSLAVIGHCGKSLVSLLLTGLQSTSEKGFWVMGNALGLSKLASLSISSCRGITDVSLAAIAKGCLNLKQMCLRQCCFVSDNGLVAFSKATQSLESLQLEECNRITQYGILGTLLNCKSKLKSLGLAKCMGIKDLDLDIPLLSPCESLRSLSIRYCPQFGDSSLAIVGKLCPKLDNLDLSGLCGVTDNGLLPMIESSEARLLKVNLNGCISLTDKTVRSVARVHGGTLEVLNVDGCTKVTDHSMVSIANNCFVLSELDISKCSISDSGVAALCCGEQLSLQILSLYGCCKVSDKSIPLLTKLGNTLVGLNLQNCNGISNSAIELLMDSLWRCDIIS